MNRRAKSITIVMADDDLDDCLLVKEAFAENGVDVDLRFVVDGEALMDYLYQRGEFADNAPFPSLILLDLNMPRKDGREALREIKGDKQFRSIPVVILTTSKEREDIAYTYEIGANSFINKPSSFDDLVGIVRSILVYWFDVVELPSRGK
ncbi:MAG: response regulator [Acidobacteriota bacterium]